MVLPNIGAILAWGLITAFVIPTGWTPNKTLAALVDPMIKTCCRSSSATPAQARHGHRGGVVEAVLGRHRRRVSSLSTSAARVLFGCPAGRDHERRDRPQARIAPMLGRTIAAR